MSGGAVVIIIGGGTNPNRTAEESPEDSSHTVIKVKIEGEGSVSERLREAADVIDGNA
jgi:hypothetical protein